MIADDHIHTRFRGHADGEPREDLERAPALGMTEPSSSGHHESARAGALPREAAAARLSGARSPARS